MSVSQPSHSLTRVAWHKVGVSTLWTVLSGRLGQRVTSDDGELQVVERIQEHRQGGGHSCWQQTGSPRSSGDKVVSWRCFRLNLMTQFMPVGTARGVFQLEIEVFFGLRPSGL